MIPNKKSAPRFSFRDPMTSTTALKVFSLPPDATFDQIKAAFTAVFERTGGKGEEFRRAALAYAMLYVPPTAPAILFPNSPTPWISPVWCMCNKKILDADGQELMDPRCIGSCPFAAQIIEPPLRRAARRWSGLPGFDVVEEAMAALLRRDSYNKPFPKSQVYSVAFGVGFDEWKRRQNQANRGDKRFGRVKTVSMTTEEGKKAVRVDAPTITPERAFAIFETLLDELEVSNPDAVLIYRHRFGLHDYVEMDIKAISRMMRQRDPKWTVALVTASIERTTKWLLKRRQEQLLKLIIEQRTVGRKTFAQIARFMTAQTGNRWSAKQIKKICEEHKV